MFCEKRERLKKKNRQKKNWVGKLISRNVLCRMREGIVKINTRESTDQLFFLKLIEERCVYHREIILEAIGIN